MNRIHVAVGVICNSEGEILIAKRADHLHQGGLWEFPGGKVEAEESVVDALVRELEEELGITAVREACNPLMEITHDYGDKQVMLDVWWVRDFCGEPEGREGQPLNWVEAAQLNDFAFPEANIAIIEKITALAER
ncbi:8-oxo-dGTP diphosphatase MutT [Spongiibacter sp. KMU-158]|uniref:8-oxo-dGTP diphosphatase n=1 Tax=Spongiibacter pelagi TaxID=2760804 RepID=A0A927C2U3_9GAMM|nr:8-oxo-dGTP diphosphatase MutT [Spongiibacter pelagi]MBD2859749.1 8-oxo-dGTP diphosphatase MutT [Spongiibacter pelagi]